MSPPVLNIKKPPTEKKTLSVCKLKHITIENFKAAFNKDAINLTSPVDTVLHQFNDELHKALDVTAPLKEIQVAANQRLPWFNEDVKARNKWYKIGNRFGTNILDLIFGRPIKWRGISTTDFSSTKKAAHK